MPNIFKNKNILVTGGAGFIGINFIKKLLRLEAKVRATIHINSPVIDDERIEYIQCDLMNKNECRKIVKGIDYIFLCAANTSGAEGLNNSPLAFLSPNLILNMHMLESAYEADVKKVLFISSTTAYPDVGNKPLKEEEFFNGDPYHKYIPVGWMYRFSEILCRIYSQKLKNRISIVVLRPSNIYGEFDNFEFETAHVLPSLVRKIVERQAPIEVWGTGNDKRDLIYINDFINAALLAVEKIDSYNPINIGFGKGYSVKQILKTILELEGYTDAKIKFDASKPSMIPVRLVDTTKAETLLGFKPSTELRDGIRKTIKWFHQEN
jgi:GDP-L-fucose synthase